MAMEIGSLFGVVLSLVLVGLVLGAGLLVLDKFASATGVTGSASTAINATSGAIDDLVDWIPIIVIMVAVGIILTLVLNAFRQ